MKKLSIPLLIVGITAVFVFTQTKFYKRLYADTKARLSNGNIKELSQSYYFEQRSYVKNQLEILQQRYETTLELYEHECKKSKPTYDNYAGRLQKYLNDTAREYNELVIANKDLFVDYWPDGLPHELKIVREE